MQNWKAFDLSKISLDDPAMEDLETFNEAYKDLNSLSQVQILSQNNAPVPLIGSKGESNFFSLEVYLTHILNSKKFTKPKLKELSKELMQLSKGSIKSLSLLKSMKSTTPKSEMVSIIVQIICDIIQIN